MTLHEEQQRVQKAVEHSFSHLQADPWLTQRVLANAKGEEPVAKKISVSMMVAMMLVILTLTGALATALNAWGIIDFAGNHANVYIPPRYEESIKQENIVVEGDNLTCQIQQSYYDGKILRVTAHVIPKNDVLLVGDCAYPGDPAANLFPSFDMEQTSIAAYALKHHEGRMASVVLDTDPTAEGSGSFRLNEDGSATLYLEAGFEDEQTNREVSLCLSYLPLMNAGSMSEAEWNSYNGSVYDFSARETILIPMTFHSTNVKTFVCEDTLAFPSVGVKVSNITLTETPREIRYTLDYEITDPALYSQQEDGLWFEFIDPNSSAAEYHAQRVSGGLMSWGGIGRVDGRYDLPDEIGTQYRQNDSIGLDALGEQYTLRAYNAWDKTRYEQVTFKVK